MKTLLTNIFILSTVLTYAQVPFPYLEGSTVTRNDKHIIELEDLKNSKMLRISQDSNLGIDYSLTSAQFIFAPRAGEAHVVRLANDTLSAPVKRIINQYAKVGDRIILDRIRGQKGDYKATFIPFLLTIVQGHHYLEDSFSIEYLKSKGAIAGEDFNKVDSDSSRLEKANHLHHTAYFEKQLDGEIRYFNAQREPIALAVFNSGTMVSKTYYFEGDSGMRIKRTITLEKGLYIQRHYNAGGYMTARGEVKVRGVYPYELSINPIGVKSQKEFSDLGMSSEFRPNGVWVLLSDDGELELSVLLVSGDSQRHSTIRERKKRKYMFIGTPDF